DTGKRVVYGMVEPGVPVRKREHTSVQANTCSQQRPMWPIACSRLHVEPALQVFAMAAIGARLGTGISMSRGAIYEQCGSVPVARARRLLLRSGCSGIVGCHGAGGCLLLLP